MPHLRYLKHFKCIGGRCEDNCCIGWDVDIDHITFLKYQKVKDAEMKILFNQHIHINTACYNPQINYAFATLTPEKKCSFLNEAHLCKIHKNLGESYLSNVCATFPRIANRIDGVFEHSATVSCPEIARLLLRDASGMKWEQDHKKENPPIITYDINQKNKSYVGKPLANLKRTRDRCLEIVLDTQMPFEKRLVQLSEYVLTLESNDSYEKMRPLTFDAISSQLIVALSKIGIKDSNRFRHFMELTHKGDIEKGRSKYQLFIDEHPHMLPNLFGNHIVKNLFPFSEGDHTTDALRLLLSRYFIIKRHFILLASLDALDVDTAIAYLQSFSKVIEHHKYFESKMLETFKKNRISLNMLIATLEVN